MSSWLEEETNLALRAAYESLENMRPSNPQIFRTLWIKIGPPHPFLIEVILDNTGNFVIKEQGDMVLNREMGEVLQYDLDGIMLKLAGDLSWRPVQMVTKMKMVMKDVAKPYILYLGTKEPPRGVLFPLRYDFRDPWTRRILTPNDRPVFLLEELQPGNAFRRQLYARDTVRRMPQVGWVGDSTAIVEVDLEASRLESFA
jgi:hypothetical protein